MNNPEITDYEILVHDDVDVPPYGRPAKRYRATTQRKEGAPRRRATRGIAGFGEGDTPEEALVAARANLAASIADVIALVDYAIAREVSPIVMREDA